MLFRENGVEFEKVNYFVEAMTEKKLRGLLKKMGAEPYAILRKAEPLAKELSLNPETPHDELIKAIVENPSLLQRPIVEVGDRAVLARPTEKALKLIKG